ncbi:hypothetical protein AGLY_006176 [Aphis glycines]|uniref:Uncharacterized protein n=1 Tax=Aphis glycines TaxID=307491 RepID=A0A6G0TT56_APHGL|nr:hypothetical protein AGLY_006176 [Aphis glycines]
MARSCIINLRSKRMKPSLYVRSMARLRDQSGPIRVMAQAIFMYKTPSAQSCHAQSTGVWCKGTRNGTTITSSKSRPNKNGIIPSNTIKATIAFELILSQNFNRLMTTVRPSGSHPAIKQTARTDNQHIYVPHAAVYSSCMLGIGDGSVADGSSAGQNDMAKRPNHTGKVMIVKLITTTDRATRTSKAIRRIAKLVGRL